MSLAFSKVAVIGAGAMGRGIAQIAAQAGSQVWLYDAQPGATSQAREALAQTWGKLAEKGKLSPEQAAGHLERLREAQTLADLAACDLVVEAIVEKIDVKKSVFAELEKVVSPEAVLVTPSLLVKDRLAPKLRLWMPRDRP